MLMNKSFCSLGASTMLLALITSACSEKPPAKIVNGYRLWAPYTEIAGIYDSFYQIPERERSMLDLKLGLETTGDKLPSKKLVFALIPGSAEMRFGIDDAGYMKFPYSIALSQKNPSIYVNLPPLNRVIISIIARYAGDVTKPINATELVKFIGQSRQAIDKQGGIWSFFMPKPEGIRFHSSGLLGRVSITYKNDKKIDRVVVPGNDPNIISEIDLKSIVKSIQIDDNVIIESYSKPRVSVTVDSESE
jgi:hypothetical protein